MQQRSEVWTEGEQHRTVGEGVAGMVSLRGTGTNLRPT